MQITCSRTELSRVFDLAASAVRPNSPKEVLQHVKMVVESGHATLMGTDTETGVLTGLKVEQTGSDKAVLLPVPPVRQILRDTEGDVVTIHVADTVTKITSGGADYKIGQSNPDEYPNVKSHGGDCYFEVSGAEFDRLIRRTSYAVDANSTRYALGGVRLAFGDDGTMMAVATDGRRLSKASCQCRFVGDRSQFADWPVVAIGSPGPLGVIASSNRSADVVKISILASDIVVESSVCTVTTRQVDGRYPNWRNAVPSYRDWDKFEFESSQMLSCIKQASILANTETHGMTFDIQPGTLNLSASSAMKGDSNVRMPILYAGKPVQLMLDYQFVNEFLRSVGGASVTLHVNTADQAAIMSTEDDSVYVLMPMAQK